MGVELLDVLSRRGSALEACHLYWNGVDRKETCRAVSSWIQQRSVRQAPPSTLRARDGANASLRSGVPFQHCALVWAQHMDYSFVERIRAIYPQRKVRGLTLLRHPVQLFFAEFLYKKHCLWRQQGRGAPEKGSAISLMQHIDRLRKSGERRTLLTHFLAGASWCSCAPERAARRKLPIEALRQRALANAAEYAMIGTLERLGPSMRLLHTLLGTARNRSTHTNDANENALEHCIRREELPVVDFPTRAQHALVTALMATDVSLYKEIDRRLKQRLVAHGFDPEDRPSERARSGLQWIRSRRPGSKRPSTSHG